jgi:aspartyl-tRNA(Asn)/glutamyl-tRNA(Gln) amidotransferase subunit A
MDAIDPEVLTTFDAALEVLRGGGAQIIEVESEPFIGARAPNTLILTSEAYAYHEATLRSRPELLGRGVRNRLREAAFLDAADYLAAQRARTVLRRQVQRILERVDAIVSPTSATPPVALAKFDPDSRFREPSFVNPGNLLGLPAISVPCGFSTSGLPIGLQIMCGAFEEPKVFRIAAAYERATPWHERHPALD